MKKSFIFLPLLLLLFASGCNTQKSSDNDSSFAYDAFLQEMFCREISENTINLHFTLAHPEKMGIADYNVTLGDLSEAAFADSNARLENYLKKLQQFNTKQFSLNDQLTYDILMDYYTLQLEFASYSLYDEPLNPSSGIHAQLPMLFEEYIFYDEQDILDYFTLLTDVDDYFTQIIDFEKEKANAGLFMPDYACQSIISQCNDFVLAGEEHFLIETFADRINALPELSPEKKETYIQQNKQLVTNDLANAYQYLASEMTTLLGKGVNKQGLCYFPEGKDYYKLLVRYYTGCSDEISEIQENISEQRQSDLTFIADLAQKDPAFWERFETASLAEKDPVDTLAELQVDMLSDFPSAPETICTVDLIDECLEDYVAPAYYITAPLDQYTQNSIHINDDYDTTSLDYFTTLAHEGFPGHLYQTVMSYESDIDPVRILTNYSGYIEGWATYVEMLSYKYADIDTDIAQALQKNQSSMLSLYASTDLGIHHDGWTLEDTNAFWNSYGIKDTTTISNIYEYIVSEPGVYLQYYVGYLEFLELKETAMEEYETSFDEVNFHQAILEIGPAPFDILNEYFDEYYNNGK